MSNTAWFLQFSDLQDVCRFKCGADIALADYEIETDHDLCLARPLSDHESGASICSEGICFLILEEGRQKD